MEEFLAEILAAYSDDQTAPSLILAKLPTGEYYAAVKRYAGRFAAGPYNVCGVKQTTLQDAVTNLRLLWLAQRAAPTAAEPTGAEERQQPGVDY